MNKIPNYIGIFEKKGIKRFLYELSEISKIGLEIWYNFIWKPIGGATPSIIERSENYVLLKQNSSNSMFGGI